MWLNLTKNDQFGKLTHTQIHTNIHWILGGKRANATICNLSLQNLQTDTIQTDNGRLYFM